jgi:alpha-tubulin suppressor-like RCC1 family protein
MEAKPQSVYIWGLFNGKEHTVPDKVKELEGKNIVKVASGGHFYMALSQQGALFAWGAAKYNRYGFTGDDQPVPRNSPLKVPIKAIAAGNWHSLLIDVEGRVHAAGHNKQGACGVGSF